MPLTTTPWSRHLRLSTLRWYRVITGRFWPTVLDGSLPKRRRGHVAEVFAVVRSGFDQASEGDRAITWLYGVAHRVVATIGEAPTRTLSAETRVLSLGACPSATPETQVVVRHEHEMLLAGS